jgi:hypothetical protein
MYNVILRRVRETIVAVEKKEVLHISVRACLCVCGRTGAGVCLRACSLTDPELNSS